MTVKLYFSFFIFLFFMVSAGAQIDSRNNSFSIPAIESPKDSASTTEVKPIAPINTQTNSDALNTPKTTQPFNLPKKEFSMMDQEEFGNPGELYQKQIDRQASSIKEEMYLGTKGSDTDQYFGEIKTKSKYVFVQYRDYGDVDGDLIRVSVNDEIIEFRVYLTSGFKGFRLELKEGYNKLDFLALNEGYALPNTAHFRILDDHQNVLVSDKWALSVNVKATINIVKE